MFESIPDMFPDIFQPTPDTFEPDKSEPWLRSMRAGFALSLVPTPLWTFGG